MADSLLPYVGIRQEGGYTEVTFADDLLFLGNSANYPLHFAYFEWGPNTLELRGLGAQYLHPVHRSVYENAMRATCG